MHSNPGIKPLQLYHLSRSFFLLTIGFVMKIANAKPATVNTSCALLKFSLSTSNVFDGAIRDEKRSSPYAKINEVDSSSAGLVMIFRVRAT